MNAINTHLCLENKGLVVSEYLEGLRDVSAASPVHLHTADLVHVNTSFLLQLVLLLEDGKK